jgi:hypothetical protein
MTSPQPAPLAKANFRSRGTPSQRARRSGVLGCQPPNGVFLGRAKADSPSPRDGPKHPVLKSDLEPFRAQFKHEVEKGETK